ncbi:MAG: hypothetical protein JNL32_10590 [Candidatus Kapabacteria bacterium]|nr:hypothetical protein [Candidatus Kapabacteria bacterium]
MNTLRRAIVSFVILAGLALFTATPIYSQSLPRVVVLPIRNMDGNIGLNKYCYTIADSLRIVLAQHEQHNKQYTIVPADSVEMVLAEFNLDPNNPQYESDIWKAVAALNTTLVVSGTFNFNGGRMLVNIYCYNAKTKIADQANAAKNIFKAPEKILDMIPVMRDKIVPALK